MGSALLVSTLRFRWLPVVRKERTSKFWWSAPVVSAAWLFSVPAQGSVELRGFSSEEVRALDAGEAVERRFELPHRGTKYLGAVSYGVLEQSCEQARGMWREPARHLVKALPATRRVELTEAGTPLSRLRIEHGNSVIQGSWGALYRVTEDGKSALFWLDTNAPRDVEDVFGYFRLSAWTPNRCLVTAAVAVDPGDGLLASLFRSMIHNYLVRTAARIQRYMNSPEFTS